MSESDVKEIEQVDAPEWEFDETELRLRKAARGAARRLDSEAQCKRLYNAYFSSEKSVASENPLLKWITAELVAGAKRKYRQTREKCPKHYSATPQSAEDISQLAVLRIAQRLRLGEFQSHNHLLAALAQRIGFFYGDAQQENRAQEADLVPLSVEWKDEDGNSLERQIPIVAAPLRYSLHTRENNLFLQCLSESDQDLFTILEGCDWDREQAADSLNMDLDSIHQQIKRIGHKFQDLRMLLIAFRLPTRNRETIEHRYDLGDRFVRLVDRMQRFTKGERPKTFDDAYRICAEGKPHDKSAILYDRDEVVRYLLKIWRKRPAIN